MNKLEVGMYVRTKYGIAKITDIICGQDVKFDNDNIFEDDDSKQHHRYDGISKNDYFFKHDVIKASHNIIDLIEEKDLLIDKGNNLYVVDRVDGDYVFTTSKNEYGLIITLVDYQIKSIVTKEQFESMSYKVGDSNE